MSLISIIHPSRGRALKSFGTIRQWIGRAGTTDLEVILSIDNDDPELNAYHNVYSSFKNNPQTFLILRDDNKSAVEAINKAARISRGDILIVVSDDSACPPNWATKIIKYTQHKSDWVLKVQDGIQPRIITQPILDRVYYQRDGFIYDPRFTHAWSDRWFTELAHKRKRVITKNIMFRHLHYSVLKNKKRDEQYARTDATFDEGKKIYQELMKQL